MHRNSVKVDFMEEPENTISYFYHQLSNGSLVGARCRKCRALYVPPTLLCTKCYSKKLEPVKLSGRGRVDTFTIVHVAPPELQSFAPYTVVVTTLKEGPSVLGILKEKKIPVDAIIGKEVIVDYDSCARLTPGTPRLVFKLDS